MSARNSCGDTGLTQEANHMTCLRWIITVSSLLPLAAFADDLQHELLIFGSGELVAVDDSQARQEEINKNKITADVLFSLQRSSLRVFGEYMVSNQEADLERFQVGWQTTADTILWLGRFHQPGSVWNHNHHHGQFLQTTITRPAIDNWEDNDGVIPQHFTGALVESNWHLSGSRTIATAFGGGLSPTITDEGLKAFDLVRPNTGHNQMGFQARISYLPDEVGDTNIGAVVERSRLGASYDSGKNTTGLSSVDQTVIGINASATRWHLKLSSAAYYVTATLHGIQSDYGNDYFMCGYLQVEKSLASQMTVFARHEDAIHSNQAAYLKLFPTFVTTRSVAGLRWEFARRNAVTIQASTSETVAGNSFRDVRLQWSAALL
jgi:hypothetical protein